MTVPSPRPPGSLRNGPDTARGRPRSRPLSLAGGGRLPGVRAGADVPLCLLGAAPVQAHDGGIVLERAAGKVPDR